MKTATLVQNLLDTSLEDLPLDVIEEAKRSLLNWAGVAIGAANHSSMDKVLKVAQMVGGEKQATILGREEKVDILFATLMNGMSSHIFDFDDTLLETVLHPSAPVFPAILAYAEKEKKTGREVLEAFVLGCEVEARLARALYPSHYWRGWHITGTVGTIGAAVAVGLLQGLDHEQLSYAIGLAATEPTGLREMFGTMTKPFHPGKAAMNGLMAALLAEQGFTTSKESLEATRGYGNVLSDDPKLELLVDDWGKAWEIMKNSYKPYASGIVTHPSIYGSALIREKYQLNPKDVVSIEIEVHPLVKELTGKTNPQTGLEGKFSVFHCVAVGFLDGKAGVDEFSDERVKDLEVIELRDKVKLIVSEDILQDQTKLKVTTKDGKTFDLFVEHAIGSIDVPMTTVQLKDKFRDVTKKMLTKENQDKLLNLVDSFETLEDLSEFFDICSSVKNHVKLNQ